MHEASSALAIDVHPDPVDYTSRLLFPGLLLNPEQEACVCLDSETPAIFLTAGAGTGKTQTLAARLARLLGVDTAGKSSKSVPAASTEAKGEAVAGLNEGIDGRGTLEGDHEEVAAARTEFGGRDGRRLEAAPPESVLVLSFTNQVTRGSVGFPLPLRDTHRCCLLATGCPKPPRITIITITITITTTTSIITTTIFPLHRA